MIYAMEKNYLERYLKERAEFKLNFEESAAISSGPKDTPEDLKIENGTAIIEITGPLSRSGPDFWDMLLGYGGTSYTEIIQNIALANVLDEVKNIKLMINSPGGDIDGVGEAAKAIRESAKPTLSHVQGMAASAGYWLASQANKIEVASKDTRVGSIGVVATIIDVTKAWNDAGFELIEITNSDSPNKRVDPKTDEGQNTIRAELDDLFSVFVSDVAAGRSISEKKVVANFGRGGMVIAEKALTAGMIDSVSNSVIKTENKTALPKKGILTNGGSQIMTKEEFKLENPALYAELVGMGRAEEKDRVEAHLIYGENCGAVEYSHECIKDGTATTDQAVIAKYMVEGQKKKDIDARDADNIDAVEKPAETKTEDEQVRELTAAVLKVSEKPVLTKGVK